MPVIPGVPGANLPPGDDAIIRRIQELERSQREVFGQWAEMFAATFTSLSTQLDSITALVNSQVAVGRNNAGSSGFPVPVATTAIVSTTIPVPAGYSQALVLATTSMTVWSTTTGTAAIYLQAGINAVTLVNASSSALDPPHGFNWANLSASASKTLTGLSGGNITINACAGSLTALPSNASNSINLDCLAVFLR